VIIFDRNSGSLSSLSLLPRMYWHHPPPAPHSVLRVQIWRKSDACSDCLQNTLARPRRNFQHFSKFGDSVLISKTSFFLHSNHTSFGFARRRTFHAAFELVKSLKKRVFFLLVVLHKRLTTFQNFP
jgi:hypothetical protein